MNPNKGRPVDPPALKRVYSVERDVPTGCWRVVMYDLPASMLGPGIHEEPRHMPGAMWVIEQDARKRDR